jgi:hypothetical protein
MLQCGELVAGLLEPTGRLREALVVVFASGGRVGQQQRPVAWRGVELFGELVASGAEVVLAHAARVHHLGGVGGQPLAAVPPRHHTKLLVLLLGGAVSRRHVQRLPLRVAADGGLGGDHAVEGGLADRARAPDVQPLAVLRAADPHQYLVAGDLLRLVPRRGVAQVHGAPVGIAAQPPRRPLVQILPRQGDLAAVLQLERHPTLRSIQRHDLAAAGVGDPERLEGVLAAHHLIPHRKRSVCDLEPLGTELTFLVSELLAGGVELVHLITQVRQDGDAAALLERGPPVRQHRLLELPWRLGGHQPRMLPIGVQGLVDVALAELLDRLALPRLGLAAVLGQGGGAKPQPQASEPAAGLDRGQLLVVAHQHDLRAGQLGMVQEPGELAGADHVGLVHHQHRLCVQDALALAVLPTIPPGRLTPNAQFSLPLLRSRTPVPTVGVLPIQLSEQGVHRAGVLEPLGVQADGGDPGRRRPQDPVALKLPSMAGNPSA